MSSRKPTGIVLVLGGNGFYGSRVVADLLATTEVDVVVGGRHRRCRWHGVDRVSESIIDVREHGGLESASRAVDLVVHCAGPFVDLPLAPLDVAIASGIPYIDIAEDRSFASAVRERHATAVRAGVPVLTGMSVCPGMEALAARDLSSTFDEMTACRTYAAPDTRQHRGPAMFETMLAGAGRPVGDPRAGRDATAATYGWSEPEWFELPPPIGRRLTYRIRDMADIDDLSASFGVVDVVFKAGSEWPRLNVAVGAAAMVRSRTGHPDWRRFARPVRALSWLVGRFGRDEGGVAFEVTGTRLGGTSSASLAITAERDGGRIPSLLASIAASEVLAGPLHHGGRRRSVRLDRPRRLARRDASP